MLYCTLHRVVHCLKGIDLFSTLFSKEAYTPARLDHLCCPWEPLVSSCTLVGETMRHTPHLPIHLPLFVIGLHKIWDKIINPIQSYLPGVQVCTMCAAHVSSYRQSLCQCYNVPWHLATHFSFLHACLNLLLLYEENSGPFLAVLST